MRDHCHLAPDYNADLHEWVSNDYYDDNVHKIQLPYTNVSYIKEIQCTNVNYI